MGMKIYHGTSKENADNIIKYGFKPNSKNIGMSSIPNDVFVFATPDLATAKYFAKNNMRVKNPVILEAEVSGKILTIDGSHSDFDIFGIVSDMLDARPKPSKIEGEYDEKLIANALKNNSYSGIAFKDKNGGNRKALALLPETISDIKIIWQGKVSSMAKMIILASHIINK